MCQRLPPEPIPSVVEGVRHFWGQQNLGGILLFECTVRYACLTGIIIAENQKK